MENQPVYGNIPSGLDQSRLSIPEEYVEYNLENPTEETGGSPPSIQSRPKTKSTQDVYDEDNYCLARGSEVIADTTSNEDKMRNKTSSSPASSPSLTKNKVSAVIVCLTVGIVALSAVCIYQGVANQGNTNYD